MKNMVCPVCGAERLAELETKRALFFRCGVCAFVFRDPSDRPDDRQAVARYSLHRNSAEDPGYVSYLTKIIDRGLSAAGPGVVRVLDWGSGPVAVCSELLRARGLAVDSWDPHFMAERLPPESAYDVAFCVETAEHFFHPLADFSELAARVRPGGLLVLHTHIVPDDDAAFRSWWYKEDPTHVSFYSIGTLARLAFIAGLSPIAFEDGRLALFQRPFPVLAAGGANYDIEGRSFARLVPGDSNPGSIRFFPGGAGRNAAEDLSRLGLATEFLSAVGDDVPGREILDGCRDAGIGVDGVSVVAGETTSTYLSILDESGEAALALSGMGIYGRFSAEAALSAAERALASARRRSFAPTSEKDSDPPISALVVDANLRPETVEALLDRFPTVPAWFDPVSSAKARIFAEYRDGALLGRFRGIKPNLAEAEALSGRAVSGRDARERGGKAAEALRSRGVEAILYISMGSDGVFLLEGERSDFFKPPPVEIVSTTGAGDAFFASVVRSYVLGRSGPQEVARAAATASFALLSADASPKELSGARVEAILDSWQTRGEKSVG